MRQILVSTVVAASLMFSAPVRADEAARAVISAQIEAFLADDLERAFGYASPVIQRKFGTPERFGAMVRDGYPMVWRPADLMFLDATPTEDAVLQPVRVRGPRGMDWIVDYEMIEGAAGWRINGVRVRRAPQTGV